MRCDAPSEREVSTHPSIDRSIHKESVSSEIGTSLVECFKGMPSFLVLSLLAFLIYTATAERVVLVSAFCTTDIPYHCYLCTTLTLFQLFHWCIVHGTLNIEHSMWWSIQYSTVLWLRYIFSRWGSNRWEEGESRIAASGAQTRNKSTGSCNPW